MFRLFKLTTRPDGQRKKYMKLETGPNDPRCAYMKVVEIIEELDVLKELIEDLLEVAAPKDIDVKSTNDDRLSRVREGESGPGELHLINHRELTTLSAVRWVNDNDAGLFLIWKEDFSTGMPVFTMEKDFSDEELDAAQLYYDSIK
jgi:hypothetical protein